MKHGTYLLNLQGFKAQAQRKFYRAGAVRLPFKPIAKVWYTVEQTDELRDRYRVLLQNLCKYLALKRFFVISLRIAFI